jgi:hypothetical protein
VIMEEIVVIVVIFVVINVNFVVIMVIFVVISEDFVVITKYRKKSRCGVYLNSSFLIDFQALAAILFMLAENPIVVLKLLIGFNHQI